MNKDFITQLELNKYNKEVTDYIKDVLKTQTIINKFLMDRLTVKEWIELEEKLKDSK